MLQLQSAFGVILITAVAFVYGGWRRSPPWRLIATAIGLQFALAVLLLKVPAVADVMLALNALVGAIGAATQAGTALVFGYVGGGPLPFAPTDPGAGFVLAFQALPVILVISALSALLYHWRVMPWIVRRISLALQSVLGVGGAVGISTAANIFVGMVEAPLLIRPYLARLTRGELFVVMTGGMAGVAGTVMVLYAVVLGPIVPGALGHILVASLLSAPAAIMIGSLMVPSTGRTEGEDLPPESPYASSMDAVVRGTQDGISLTIAVAAMLVVFVALVALTNAALAILPDLGGAPLTLQRALGWVGAPLAFAMGVPAEQAAAAGGLLGIKTILNEFVAYLELARIGGEFDERSRMILLYGLCGFANFGSLGIMIGGLTAMAPERRADVLALGLPSILSGTLSSCMTGAVVGCVLG